MSQYLTTFKHKKVEKRYVVVMSANKYWLDGIDHLTKGMAIADCELLFCHTLSKLQHYITTLNVVGAITGFYGNGEQLVDWLRFREWFLSYRPAVGMILIGNAVCKNRRIISDIAGKVINPAVTVSQMEEHIQALGEEKYRFDFQAKKKKVTERLTRREMDFFISLCEGHTPDYLARRLSVSPKTISVYKYNVLHKLGVRSMPRLYKIYNGLY